MKVKDLIELPPKPKKVINLEEATTRDKRETIETFVLTKKLQSIFIRILSSIAEGRGEGFWLLGAYGSGKSHFLSFLNLLFTEPKIYSILPGSIIDRFQNLFKEKWLVISFSLTEKEDFKQVLFRQLEKKIPGFHRSSAEFVVDTFYKENWKAIDRDNFFKFINRNGVSLEEWESFDKQKAAPLIIKYLQENGFLKLGAFEQKEIPQIEILLQRALSLLPSDTKGIIIIIDELSHYLLRKKEQGRLMHELDILQSLGESVRELPVWTVSALQMNPLELKTVSKELNQELNKVNDRYTKLFMSGADINEIINFRIARKTEQNRERIRKQFKEMKKEFPHLVDDYTESKFVNLYPFHKQYIASLTKIAEFSSRERTVIQELWYTLSENLNRSAGELLTVEILFDRFQKSILQSKFYEFYQLFNDQFKPILQRKDFKGDKILAEKIVKTLIILKLCHDRGATPEEIAHLLMEGLGLPVKNSIIYEEIASIMEELVLHTRGKHIHIIDSTNPVKKLYEIDPYREYYSVLYELRNLSENYTEKDLHKAILDLFPEATKKNDLPGEAGQKRRLIINWRNTRRKGYVKFEDLRNISGGENSGQVPGIDFELIIGLPVRADLQKFLAEFLKQEENMIIWFPLPLSKMEERLLRKYLAVKTLLNDRYYDPVTDEEKQKNQQLLSEFKNIFPRAVEIIKKIYRNGKILGPGWVFNELKAFASFSRIIQEAAAKVLDEIYPDFPYLKKKTGRYHTNKLIKEFVLEEAREQLTSEMKNVGTPLGIVREREGRFELTCKGEFFVPVIRLLNKKGSCSVKDDIIPLLSGKPYGLTDFLIEVVLVSGIVKGEWRGRNGKGEIITGNELDLKMIGSGKKSLIKQINDIEKGDLLSASEWEQALKASKLLLPELKQDLNRSLRNQDLLWARLRKKQKELLIDINQAIRVLTLFLKTLDRLDLIKKINRPLLKVHHLLDQDFYSSLPDSREGILEFLEFIKKTFGDFDKLSEGIKELNLALEFVKKRVDQSLISASNYLQKSMVPNRGYQQLKILKTALVRRIENIYSFIYVPRVYKNFMIDFSKFKKQYIKLYLHEHQAFHLEVRGFVDSLFELDEYRALSLLNKIRPIRVAYNLKPIKKYVDNFFPGDCHQNQLEEHLKKNPICSCGFTLGERFLAPELEKIKPMLRKGINEYLDQFNNTRRFRKFLEAYVQENPDSCLQEILDINPGEVDKLIKILNENVIDEINMAFQTTIPIRISQKEILSSIAGSYPASRIDEVVGKFKKVLLKKLARATEEFNEVNPERIILLFDSEAG